MELSFIDTGWGSIVGRACYVGADQESSSVRPDFGMCVKCSFTNCDTYQDPDIPTSVGSVNIIYYIPLE